MNPNVVFTWTLNSDRVDVSLSFDMRTLHEYSEFPAVVAYCFKKHTWYLFTSGAN